MLAFLIVAVKLIAGVLALRQMINAENIGHPFAGIKQSALLLNEATNQIVAGLSSDLTQQSGLPRRSEPCKMTNDSAPGWSI